MRCHHLCFLVTLIFFVSCSDDATIPVSPDREGGDGPTFSKVDAALNPANRYIVVFRKAAGNVDAVTDQLIKEHGGQVHFRYRHALQGFAATLPEQALEGIRRNPNVDYIEPDGIASINTIQPSPPSWGLDRIDQHPLPLDAQYEYQNEGTGVTVYVIDTGIRFDHVEFGGRAGSGYDFIDNDNDASDCHGHGTHVAGTVGGINVGVAKNVDLVAVRVLNCAGSGYYSQVIAGVDWVTANHGSPAVANMSLGGSRSNALNNAVDNSVASGVVYAVAAGNSNKNACNYSPAGAPSALTVGATTLNDVRSSFSNHGSCVDIFAPGSGITSSTMNSTNSYATWSGTSMASPHVAGVAALYLSANPGATPAQVETAIKTGATSGVLSNIRTGSPNLLLYSLIAGSVPGPPAAPTALSATAMSSSRIDLSWSDNSNDETGFKIERSTNGGSGFAEIATVGANVTAYSNTTGLTPNTTYYYRVFAHNGYGNSTYSNTAGATTFPDPPAAPDGLSATAVSSSQIDISWTDNSDNETGFRIERSLDGVSFSELSPPVGADVTTYSNTGLSAETQYWYRIRAYNAGGYSAYSNTDDATTFSGTNVHVWSIVSSTSSQGKNWFGHLQVTVHDASHGVVEGVRVDVSWSGEASGSDFDITDGSGQCTISTPQLKGKKVSSITMTVTNLSGSGFTYDIDANDPPFAGIPPSAPLTQP